MLLSGVCVGTKDLETAGLFYDAVLRVIGMERLSIQGDEIGYGPEGGAPNFWVLLPFDGKPASHGNGVQVMFEADKRELVDLFHKTALLNGGVEEGAPGPRDYAPGYYGAYVRDPDFNKLHISLKL